MTPGETVEAFIASVTSGDHERAAQLASENLVYENIGFEPTSFVEQVPTIHGIENMLAFLAPLQDCDWPIHRQTTLGNVVITERTDRFTINGHRVEVAVAGVFEVIDGQITFWRDYSDMQTLTQQMTR